MGESSIPPNLFHSPFLSLHIFLRYSKYSGKKFSIHPSDAIESLETFSGNLMLSQVVMISFFPSYSSGMNGGILDNIML